LQFSYITRLKVFLFNFSPKKSCQEPRALGQPSFSGTVSAMSRVHYCRHGKGFAAGKIEYNAKDSRIISPAKTGGVLAQNRGEKRGMRIAKGISINKPTAINSKCL
jgi:hypothetical protein